MRTYVGVEIGGTKLQLVVGDSNAVISDRLSFAVEPALGASGIRDQIARALPKLLASHTPAGIGVGFGGPVHWRTGKICRSHQIEGWSEFEIAGWLHGLTRLPVAVDNDANVAALGEAWHGAGVGSNPVFYVTLGSGVGGGLVLDGKVYHGTAPGEAELGHVRLDRDGTTVESRCSGWAVDNRIRELAQQDPSGLLGGLIGNNHGAEARHLPTALGKGDALARKILAELAEDLAFGLSHVVHLFHPEMIILGGGLSQTDEPLRAAVASALPPFLMEAFAPGPRITLTRLGKDAVPIGALVLAGTREE